MEKENKYSLKTLNEEGLKFYMLLGIVFGIILFVFFGGLIALGMQNIVTGIWTGGAAAIIIFCQKTYEGYRNEYDI